MSIGGKQRVLSGMRPTGQLHLGHYHGVLKNWLKLQQEYECFFFVADWHALTTEYEDPAIIEKSVWDMVIDWLAVGVNPGSAKLFIQSRVPEHAELHLLLSMCTPLSWLERVPSYKDQQEKLSDKDKQLIKDAAFMTTMNSWLTIGDEDAKALEYFKGKGNVIIELDAEVQYAGREAGLKWAEGVAKENAYFKKILDHQNEYFSRWKDSGKYRNVKVR